MERKVSKFEIGDKVTTEKDIESWATGATIKLKIHTVEKISEKPEGVFSYDTNTSFKISEESVVPLHDARAAAIAHLTEQIKSVATFPFLED